MLQARTAAYDLQSLLPMNRFYDHEHHLDQEDVDMVNDLVAHIERTRSSRQPRIGDRVVYISKDGDWYGNALIEKFKGGACSLCLDPYTPFIWKSPLGIGCSVSGGPFTSIESAGLRFAGWTEACYKDWGHCGACGNGSVTFKARAAQWTYREPNPIYGEELTTETWRKLYISKRAQPDSPYLYHGDDFALRDDAEFEQFVQDYEGRGFPGSRENQFIVWCYRDVLQNLSQEEWKALNAPVSSRRIYNAQQPVKVVKNHSTHERICYYVQPDFHVEHA